MSNPRCRIGRVTLKSNGQSIRTINRVESSPAIEKLISVIEHARDIKCHSFAVALRGEGPWITTGFDVGDDTYGLVGAIEELKSRILEGECCE